ncbi:MAG: ThuA domain-containing protein [Bacteroidetes bacterium]|nr:ThuA domain-containing protein [Bacteroidota bacterium]
MSKPISTFLLVLISVILFAGICSGQSDEIRILIFSKTAGFRHSSIEAGIVALEKLAKKEGYVTEHAEDASIFKEKELKRFNTVIFLNTTGDVLDHNQQADFERFIQAGGGYMGIHAASDTEYDWEWYGRLVGAYFKSHPNIQPAILIVENSTHPATDSLPPVWEKTDEWYNFGYISDQINVLIRIDENSYEGGENGAYHPMSWYQEFNGGRSFYTAMGHTEESYQDPLFMRHIAGGLKFVVGK